MSETAHPWLTEGDAWYARNKQVLGPERCRSDPILKLLEAHGVRPPRVVEIGAADGYRVAWMHEHWGAEGVAVDISKEAVEAGEARYPDVRHLQAPSHDVPLDDESADVVVLNFVLHWVHREHLLRTCAEADRLLAPGGHLALGDFHPPHPQRVDYHHRPGLYTYKQDYAALFLATCGYERVERRLGNHADPTKPPERPEDALSYDLLRKTSTHRPATMGGSPNR